LTRKEEIERVCRMGFGCSYGIHL